MNPPADRCPPLRPGAGLADYRCPDCLGAPAPCAPCAEEWTTWTRDLRAAWDRPERHDD